MKRTVLFIFLIVVLLSFAACGSKKNASSDGNGQTIKITTNDKGEEGYYDSEGYFWLSDGSGYYDTNGTFVTTNAPDTSQEATEVTVFKDKLIGNYGTASSANVVVEAGQATICYEGDTYTLPGSAFSEARGEGNQNDYDFYVNDTGASGTLSFYEDADIPLQVEVKYTDNSGADLYFSVTKGYVLDRLPLEGYESLDSQGEFGAIPMSEDVKKLLFEGMTDDYIFTYYSESSASVTDSDGFATGVDCTWYEITSFDENGFDNSDTYSNYVYEFKNKSDADAFYKSELNGTAGKVVTQSGNAVGESSSDESTTEIYKKPGGKWSKLHCMYVYEKGIVYGEHCMYDDYDDKYIYFSKPYTIEEGKVFNETSILMGSMYCSQVTSTDNKYTLSIEGDIHENNIKIRDNEGNTIMDGTCYVKAFENTIIGYRYDLYGTACTYVAELTLDGDTISVKYYEYDGTGDITYDNYKDAKAVSEGEFQATIPEDY